MDQCRASKRDGSRCTLPANGSQGLCWAHDPQNAERRRRAATGAVERKLIRRSGPSKTRLRPPSRT
jgi:hypothetical protein